MLTTHFVYVWMVCPICWRDQSNNAIDLFCFASMAVAKIFFCYHFISSQFPFQLQYCSVYIILIVDRTFKKKRNIHFCRLQNWRWDENWFMVRLKVPDESILHIQWTLRNWPRQKSKRKRQQGSETISKKSENFFSTFLIIYSFHLYIDERSFSVASIRGNFYQNKNLIATNYVCDNFFLNYLVFCINWYRSLVGLGPCNCCCPMNLIQNHRMWWLFACPTIPNFTFKRSAKIAFKLAKQYDNRLHQYCSNWFAPLLSSKNVSNGIFFCRFSSFSTWVFEAFPCPIDRSFRLHFDHFVRWACHMNLVQLRHHVWWVAIV